MTVAAVDQLERMLWNSIRAKLGMDPSGELDALPLGELAIVYENWCSRLVAARPRQVHLSSTLIKSATYALHRTDVDAIATTIDAGGDISPHLSKGIKTPYVPTSKRDPSRRFRADLDRLVAEWRIHHLHLSSVSTRSGFVKRGDALLFARFEKDDAYLIEVRDHSSWTAKSLFEICVREWPAANLFASSISGLSLTRPFTPAELTQNRWAGMTSLIEVDGKLYMPPGQSTAGTAFAAADASDRLMHLLQAQREYFAAHPNDDQWVAHEESGTEFFGFWHDGLRKFRPVVGLAIV